MEKSYCANCGNRLMLEDVGNCPNCGSPIRGTRVPAPPPAPEAAPAPEAPPVAKAPPAAEVLPVPRTPRLGTRTRRPGRR